MYEVLFYMELNVRMINDFSTTRTQATVAQNNSQDW